MDIAFPIILTVVLVLGNSYFSAAELSCVSAKRIRLEQAAEEGNARAQKALDVSSDSDGLFATIQVYITLMSLFASAAAATTLSDPFSAWMTGMFGLSPNIAGPIATVIITLIVSYFTIVVGEVFPKRVGWAYPEEVSMALAGSLSVFSKIAKPLVWITAKSSDALARLFHVRSPEDHQNVSEEELKFMVADNAELLPEEKHMVAGVLDMSETTAGDIMTPRTDVVFVEDIVSVKDALDRMYETGYSRLPVFHDNYDRILGIVRYKDLARELIAGNEDKPVGGFVEEAPFVPETKDIFPLLKEMQVSRQQLAIVVDEYGGFSGLISIEDIIEEIVGDINDETDTESTDLDQVSEREWLVDGSLPVNDAKDLGWPVEESDNYDTIAGWLLDMIDSIPQVGDVYEHEGYRFTVRAMSRHRLQTLHVLRLEAPEEPEGEAAE